MRVKDETGPICHDLPRKLSSYMEHKNKKNQRHRLVATRVLSEDGEFSLVELSRC
jgi:hypothetical protein